jgi:glycosyltransferase involved in cell wall biosynthesis
MRVMHLATYSVEGGAARAAYRIHDAMLTAGMDSRMRVLKGYVDGGSEVGAVQPGWTVKVAQRAHQRWVARTERSFQTDNVNLHTFGRIGAGLVDECNTSDVDVLNLHWVSNLLSVTDIGRLKKPVVWTLHDMWAFCGGEHYSPDCPSSRFRQGYRTDNRPDAERGPDLNRRTWEKKRREWARQRFTIVAPSRWMADCARQSVIFRDAVVRVIPYPFDMTNHWRPIDRRAARMALSLPVGRKLVLMGAAGGTSDPRKGSDLLLSALTLLARRGYRDAEVLVFGQKRPTLTGEWPWRVNWLGEVRDDRLLKMVYSAADVMVVPSRQDNLPNTAIEAQACGTPVVAFDVGGLGDIVLHRETGWLAQAFDTSGLADGIEWVLGDEARWRALSSAARSRVEGVFSPAAIAMEYANCYGDALRAASARAPWNKAGPTR